MLKIKTMTPEEKAKELIFNHEMQCRECGGIETAKIHASRVCEEMLSEYPPNCPSGSYEMERHLFWKQVYNLLNLPYENKD
jgi:hypothetical protein